MPVPLTAYTDCRALLAILSHFIPRSGQYLAACRGTVGCSPIPRSLLRGSSFAAFLSRLTDCWFIWLPRRFAVIGGRFSLGFRRT